MIQRTFAVRAYVHPIVTIHDIKQGVNLRIWPEAPQRLHQVSFLVLKDVESTGSAVTPESLIS